MNNSVTVLLENGRRQRVAVKLNTPILGILEEVCKKHQLNPDSYNLKFHNRILDVTSTVQFCGLNNNAQLEIVPAVKSRVESPVSIFLQLEDGIRLSGSFLPSNTLWDVINKLCTDDIQSKPDPVIIYMRQEVQGDKLKSTTLKMLGLTSGSALLRFLHRTNEQLKTQSVSSIYILPTKPKPPEEFHRKKILLEDSKDKSTSEERTTEVKVEEIVESKPEMEFTKETIVDQESDKISVNNAETAEAMEVDDADKSEQKCESVKSEQKDEEPHIPPFNINDVEYIGDRYALMFRADSVKSPRFDDTSDEFFELTIEDAKTLLQDIRRTRSELEEGTLETSALKARKKSMQIERTLAIYPNCVIRILFSNRIVLQGIFASTESVSEVINFVKNFLVDSSQEFYLYTSPPKTILKPDQNFIDIEAIPGSNFYFGSDTANIQSNELLNPEVTSKLVSPEVALKVALHFRNISKANRQKLGDTSTHQLPVVSEESDNSVPAPSPIQPSTSVAPSPSVPKIIPSGKVPKWFKKP